MDLTLPRAYCFCFAKLGLSDNFCKIEIFHIVLFCIVLGRPYSKKKVGKCIYKRNMPTTLAGPGPCGPPNILLT